MFNKFTQITLTEEEFDEAIELGTQRDAKNIADGVGHNQSFKKRMELLGPDAGKYFHQQGAIGEAVANNYFTRISKHFGIPRPERSGWHAWTRAERIANELVPDIRWLDRDIEVKTAEQFTRFGITKKLVWARRPLIVIVPEISGPDQLIHNKLKFSRRAWVCGVIELTALNTDEAWESLEAAWYDKTGGRECRIVPFKSLTTPRDWAKQQVDDYLEQVA